MLLFALIIFASCVLTVIFWAAVVAAAMAILEFVLLLVRGIWWLITRPIVWLVIRPIQFVFGIKNGKASNRNLDAPKAMSAIRPSLAPDQIPPMTEKLDQLGKLTALLEDGVLNQNEFDRMKKKILAK
ncbi:MAG: hypothetical protein BGN82_02170 [Alphaproteobacteria bacterium 65-7]|nr:MAG: hypothetical protein BGN82_02170 [Alphaproteobacteria bacterium 65-7]